MDRRKLLSDCLDIRSFQKIEDGNYLTKTSSEIVSEAKASVTAPMNGNTKFINTKRPFTPRESSRILFGNRKTQRPPSSISLKDIRHSAIETVSQNVPYELAPSKSVTTKLPQLINHASYSSIDKLSDLSSLIPKERLIHSSSVDGLSNNQNLKSKNETFAARNGILPPISYAWLENEKSIKENSFNESRDKIMNDNEDNIRNIIAQIQKISKNEFSNNVVLSLVDKLQICLSKEIKGKWEKMEILKIMFDLVEKADDALLVSIARIILTLKVTGSNLTSATKVVFKISRNENNDRYFREKNLIPYFVDCLAVATPMDDTEALIYGYGAFKFLTMNSNLLEIALNHGIIQLMSLHLKMINLEKLERNDKVNQLNHVLYQLTGCLRNVANNPGVHSEYASAGTLQILCQTVQLFHNEEDTVSNISRIISILSTDESCCEVIGKHGIDTLIFIVRNYGNNEEIIVRIMYALGNVLANYQDVPLKMDEEIMLEVIVKLLEHYLRTDLDISSDSLSNKTYRNSVEDILVKIIRVIANMCTNLETGIALTSYHGHSESINKKKDKLVDILITILYRKNMQENEELVLCVLGAINNLSYYSTSNTSGPIQIRSLDIVQALNSLIMSEDTTCVIPTARVLGNMTRSSLIRSYLLETGGLNYMIKWLDSSDNELLCTTVGVFINMLIDNDAKYFFNNNFNILRLVKILENSRGNWHLAHLVCQLIWNFGAEENEKFCIDENIMLRLIDILVNLLDDSVFSITQNLENDKNYKKWEEFSIVATDILEKLEQPFYTSKTDN